MASSASAVGNGPLDAALKATDVALGLDLTLLDLTTRAVTSGKDALAEVTVRVRHADQETVGGLDVTVRRNAFGRQVDSFEADLAFAGLDEPVHAVFIRAPWVEEAGPDVDVLARVPAGDHPAAGRIVAVRQGPLTATSFHPEFGGGDRIHAMFVERVRRAVEAGADRP